MAAQLRITPFGLHELTAHVSHAWTPDDFLVLGQFLVDAVFVGMQHSLVTFQGFHGVVMAASETELEEAVRRIASAATGIDPEIGLLTAAFPLHLEINRGFVGKDNAAGKYPFLHRLVERGQGRAQRYHHPLGQGLVADLDVGTL